MPAWQARPPRERAALGRAQTQTLRASRRASQCKTPKIALKGLEKSESSHPKHPLDSRQPRQMSFPRISMSIEPDDDFLFTLSDVENEEKPATSKRSNKRARATKKGGKKAATKKGKKVMDEEVEVKEEVIGRVATAQHTRQCARPAARRLPL